MARPRLFDRVKAAFEAAIAGEAIEYEMVIPEPVKEYTAQDVLALRACLRMTQADFARILNVSKKAVESWESGARKPNAATARLLQVVEDPDAFGRVIRNREAMAAAMQLGLSAAKGEAATRRPARKAAQRKVVENQKPPRKASATKHVTARKSAHSKAPGSKPRSVAANKLRGQPRGSKK